MRLILWLSFGMNVVLFTGWLTTTSDVQKERDGTPKYSKNCLEEGEQTMFWLEKYHECQLKLNKHLEGKP